MTIESRMNGQNVEVSINDFISLWGRIDYCDIAIGGNMTALASC